MFTADQLAELCDVVVAENRRRDRGDRPLYVLYDQVYWTLAFGGARHVDPVSLRPAMRDYTVYVDGISKAFAATGVRVGWVAGPAPVMRAMTDVLGHVGAWAPRAEQAATARFLADDAAVTAYQAGLLAGVRARLDALHAGFAALGAAGHPVRAVAPEGAIYLTVRLALAGRRTAAGDVLDTDEAVRRWLLDAAGLALVPFQAFGTHGDQGWFGSAARSARPRRPRSRRCCRGCVRRSTPSRPDARGAPGASGHPARDGRAAHLGEVAQRLAHGLGTSPSTATTASASPPCASRAWWYSAMFTPASPSSVPTRPITPGTSRLVSTTSVCRGFTSTGNAPMRVSRGPPSAGRDAADGELLHRAAQRHLDPVGRERRAVAGGQLDAAARRHRARVDEVEPLLLHHALDRAERRGADERLARAGERRAGAHR
jgi:hypothetical protein